jgi:hypothetical protein
LLLGAASLRFVRGGGSVTPGVLLTGVARAVAVVVAEVPGFALADELSAAGAPDFTTLDLGRPLSPQGAMRFPIAAFYG